MRPAWAVEKVALSAVVRVLPCLPNPIRLYPRTHLGDGGGVRPGAHPQAPAPLHHQPRRGLEAGGGPGVGHHAARVLQSGIGGLGHLLQQPGTKRGRGLGRGWGGGGVREGSAAGGGVLQPDTCCLRHHLQQPGTKPGRSGPGPEEAARLGTCGRRRHRGRVPTPAVPTPPPLCSPPSSPDLVLGTQARP